MNFGRWFKSVAKDAIEVKDEISEEVTLVVEVCFFCCGDAATSCCKCRDAWVRLHGSKAPLGVHCPHELRGTFVDRCTMLFSGWKEGARVESLCDGLSVATFLRSRVCLECGRELERTGLGVRWDVTP